MVRSATTTAAASNSGRLEPPPNVWKRGHVSRGSVGDKIQVIPGFKTSAAFLSSLGANLRISDDELLLPSPLNSPALHAFSDWNNHLPPPSPLAFASMPSDDTLSDTDSHLQAQDDIAEDPLDSIPPLTYEVADDEDDLIEGLKLVADSVAQQRQTSSRILIFHPLNMALYIAFMAVLTQYFYETASDLPLLFTTASGITMGFLVTVRWLTQGYLNAAEEINWDWLADDQVLISKFGDEIIGALVLRWEKGEGRGNKKKKGRGVIRAWTIKLRYRGKGVGAGLLEDAVNAVEKRGGDEIVFADDHANSKRILHRLYNASFDRNDLRAREALANIVYNTPTFGVRKK
ncbi:hypothetical protein BLS_005973 [Venturia inaequalis]|nr:hypothetical protein BLS_005973 [Venturia inaequalis]KAE9976433.1 hypothetical protein EG327_008035 [Venturia inaequalis]RDI78293.1 hypothetical protein Vi05172_g11729 [Venturia inaequalis]